MNTFHGLKYLLSSKDLFRNWLSAGIKYLLIKNGLIKGDIIVKCNNNIFALNPDVYSFIVKAYNNGYFKEVSCSEDLRGRLWGAIDLIVLKDGEGFLKMPDSIMLSLESFDPLVIAETWLYDIHFLGSDLTNWFVLDIGAFIGDTALYYAKRGAFVVAVEPLPSNYEAMLRNIELNPDLKSRIVPINVAVGPKDGCVEFVCDKAIDGGASMYGNGRRKIKVRSVRLSTLIKEINARGVDLSRYEFKALKMDCKGCEYDVIHEPDALKLFDIIKTEYSGYLRNKTYHELKKALEDLGFKCRVYAHNEFALRIGLDKHGMLTCNKDVKSP